MPKYMNCNIYRPSCFSRQITMSYGYILRQCSMFQDSYDPGREGRSQMLQKIKKTAGQKKQPKEVTFFSLF